MFKQFKKNDKYLSIAIYTFAVVAILILFGFFLFNFSKIGGFIGGIISALSAFIYGFAIAYICNSISRVLNKYVFKFVELKKPHPKLRTVLSVVFAYIVFFGFITLVFMALIPSLVSNAKQMLSNFNVYIEAISSFSDKLFDFISKILPSIDKNDFTNSFNSILGNENEIVNSVMNFFKNNLLIIGQATIGTIIYILVGIILSVYFLIYKKQIIAKIKRFLCSVFKKNTFEGIMDFAIYTDKTFGRYILGTICDSAIIGLLTFIVLAISGMTEYTVLISVFVGITNVIPFFGPFIGAIPSAIIILIDTNSIWKVLIFCIIILAIQQFDGNILKPYILGVAINMSPIAVIAAVTLTSHLFGIMGLIIGVPLCAVILYYIDKLIAKKLKKKNLPSELKYYDCDNVFEDEEFIKASHETEAQNRLEFISKMEKLKDEELSKESAIVEAEEKILAEQSFNENI